MKNILADLVWKYAGFFDADPDGGQYEIWFLVFEEDEYIARFIRHNEKFIKNNKEFLEKHTSWHCGPHFSYHKWYRNALPWQEIGTQLDDGTVLFALSDGGTSNIEFNDVCRLEPMAMLKKEMSLFDQLIQDLNLV